MDYDSSTWRVGLHQPRSNRPAEPLAPLDASAAQPATSTARDGEGDGRGVESYHQVDGPAAPAGRITPAPRRDGRGGARDAQVGSDAGLYFLAYQSPTIACPTHSTVRVWWRDTYSAAPSCDMRPPCSSVSVLDDESRDAAVVE